MTRRNFLRIPVIFAILLAILSVVSFAAVTEDLPVVRVQPQYAELSAGGETVIGITLDQALHGISGFELTASLTPPDNASIVSVAVPAWALLNSTETVGGGSVTITAVDLQDRIRPGGSPVTLANITVRGDKNGTAGFAVTGCRIDDDQGNPVSVTIQTGMVKVGTLGPIITTTVPTTQVTVVPTQATTGTCPYGKVNDPYPGKCPLYEDADNDGFCDLSQSVEVTRPTTVPTTQVTAAPTQATIPPPDENLKAVCPFGLVEDPYPGKCPNYQDADEDGFCDLSSTGGDAAVIPVAPASAQAEETGSACSIPPGVSGVSQPKCPYGKVNDPAPGLCPAYLDSDDDGFCDLSQTLAANSSAVSTACPFGKVNDPYPGACAKYIDANIDGVCDYSEPGVTSGNTTPGQPPGSSPPFGILAGGLGTGCIVIGFAIGRSKGGSP